jgi:hypothetical protein
MAEKELPEEAKEYITSGRMARALEGFASDLAKMLLSDDSDPKEQPHPKSRAQKIKELIVFSSDFSHEGQQPKLKMRATHSTKSGRARP